MALRRHERYGFERKVTWDHYARSASRPKNSRTSKAAWIENISISGCLLVTYEEIESEALVRLLIRNETANVAFTAVGRITRCEPVAEGGDQTSDEPVVYRHGVEFTWPSALSDQDLDLILAFSSRNLIVASCLNRNSKSSRDPGFFA